MSGYVDRDLTRWGLRVTTRSGEGFREARVSFVGRICEHCGEAKRDALDVCTDPERRCKEADGC